MHDPTDLERINAIIKAMVHCNEEVTEDAVAKQFRYETGRAMPSLRRWSAKDRGASAGEPALQSPPVPETDGPRPRLGDPVHPVAEGAGDRTQGVQPLQGSGVAVDGGPQPPGNFSGTAE